MGCGSSYAAVTSKDDGDYMRYNGCGVDYVNYSYYQSYFNDPLSQEAWSDYYHKSLQYQNQLESHDNNSQREGDYYQYKHWYDHLPQKPSKSISYIPPLASDVGPIVKETDDTVNLVIEHSAADVRHEGDEPDCTAEDTVKLRMGLKAISTAMRITIVKHKPVAPTHGANQLKVTVLDKPRRPSVGFLVHRPLVDGGASFVDNEFPKDQALGQYSSKYKWCRPQVIYPDKEICLFHEGTSLDDIDQGCFGTCYFLATLAGLACQPIVMKQIILSDAYNIQTGVFHCRFWKFGQWVDIYTDDYLPCDETGLVGCKSNNYLGEMWVPLIEKAYAKFMGSYPDVEGGTPRDAYLALTGGCAEWLALSYYKFDSAAVYNRLANALRHGAVVVCSSTPKEDELKSYIEDRGILINHAYTVTASAIVERNEGLQESLIKLRNPWSHKEWTGAWGDRASEWYTVDEKQRTQLREIEDDGEFWMSWTEFWKIYTDLTVCSLSPDYDSDGVTDGLDNVFCIYGQWRKGQSGGWREVKNNPTYEFTVPKDTKQPIYILVESIEKLPPRIHKTTAGNVLLKDCSNSSMYNEYLGTDSLTYSTANPLTRRFEVKPGGKYHIIATKYEAGETGSFLLRIFSKQPIQIKPLRKRIAE